MSFNKSVVTVCYNRVVNLGHLYLVPSPAEHKVTLQNFIFKCGPEATRLNSFFDSPLDGAPNTRHCFELSPSKLGCLKVRIEHSLDESRVLVDLESLTDQLQLLHDFELSVDFDHDACRTDPEMSLVLNRGDTEKGRTDSVHRRVEHRVAETELGGVLYHTHACLSVAGFILHREDRNGLELTPTNG